MKQISAKQYAISLYEATEGLPVSDFSKTISNFVNIIVKNNDLKLANKIIREFENYFNLRKGIEKVKINIARKLDEKEKDSILNGLELQLNKKIELKEEIDPNLIGGARIEYGDKLIDGSIKARVDLLKSKIN